MPSGGKKELDDRLSIRTNSKLKEDFKKSCEARGLQHSSRINELIKQDVEFFKKFRKSGSVG